MGEIDTDICDCGCPLYYIIYHDHKPYTLCKNCANIAEITLPPDAPPTEEEKQGSGTT